MSTLFHFPLNNAFLAGQTLRRAALICGLSLLGHSALAELPDPLPVAEGLISGSVEEDVSVFMGIPYAAPPVGENRWRNPQPTPVWAGVRDATRAAPRCIGRGFSPQSTQALSSEDCLYLNVWTPAESQSDLLPVMVWVHGGGFFAGAGSDALYDGASLASKGAVVITINYRLGSFGFFAHPELSAESAQQRSGNYAMFDMLAALRWVQDNAEAFGGNPQNVTLFGESAGGQAVANLIASPLSEGLFQRAIMQSSGWMGLTMSRQRTLAEQEAQGVQQAQAFGADSIAELRQASAAAIFEHFPNAGNVLVDGYFLPQDASLIYARGEQQEVDVITGSNRDEAVFFGPGIQTASEFSDSARQRFGALSEGFLELYQVDNNREANLRDRESFRDEVAWHMRQVALYQEENGNNAYVYFFTRVPPGQEDRGATHVAELAYVFNQHEQNDNWTATDRQLGDMMSDYWVNFATNGDPNRVGLPSWPMYTEHSRGKVQVLGDEVENETEMVPSAETIEFYESAFEAQLDSL